MRTLGRLLHPGRHGEVCKVLRGAALRLRDAHLEAGTVQVQDSVRVRLSRRPLPRVRRSAARTRTCVQGQKVSGRGQSIKPL